MMIDLWKKIWTKDSQYQNRTKVPQNLYAQIVYTSPIVWDFDEKRFHWASVVRERN